jgi:Methyltransferase domain
VSMFFERYPRFYETHKTGGSHIRLNLRYEAIISENSDIFPGARVLDIASHDGRWSFAALKAGAAKVVGIEVQDELVRAAHENLAHYGLEAERYRFVAGDIYSVLAEEAFDADVVLCLGFLYHTFRYSEIMRLIRSISPRYLLIDTIVVPGEQRPVFVLKTEVSRSTPDAFAYGGKMLVGRPSLPALEFMLDAYGFAVERYSDWGSLLRDNQALEQAGGYSTGSRITARCVSVQS